MTATDSLIRAALYLKQHGLPLTTPEGRELDHAVEYHNAARSLHSELRLRAALRAAASTNASLVSMHWSRISNEALTISVAA